MVAREDNPGRRQEAAARDYECRQRWEVAVREYRPTLIVYKRGQKQEAAAREDEPVLILYECRQRWAAAARQGELLGPR